MNVEKKIEKLGFSKIEESRYGAYYQKQTDRYLHRVDILWKQGNAILQSYDPNLIDVDGIGNTCVGLSHAEMLVFAQKMKEYERVMEFYRRILYGRKRNNFKFY